MKLPVICIGILAFIWCNQCMAAPRAAVKSRAKLPVSFDLPKTEHDMASHWERLKTGVYRESYSQNRRVPANILRITGRTRMNGVLGIVVVRPHIKVFIPELGSGSTWVGLHWKGSWNKKWRRLANAKS